MTLIGLLWWPNEPFYLPNKIWGARNKTARKMAKRNDAGDLPIVSQLTLYYIDSK